jgi:hypothetical protein
MPGLDNRLTDGGKVIKVIRKNRPSQQLFKAFIVFYTSISTINALNSCCEGRVFLITLIKHAQQDAEPQNEGGKVVSPTHRPHFTPQKQYSFYVSGTHFCSGLSKPQGLVRPEGLGKLKNHLIGYRTRDLPVSIIVP